MTYEDRTRFEAGLGRIPAKYREPGVSVRFVRLYNVYTNGYESYFVINRRWYRNNTIVAVEYYGQVRWLGKVVPVP